MLKKMFIAICIIAIGTEMWISGFESKSEDNSTGSNPIKVEKCKEKIILFSPELWFTVS
jgi:hypothetical protein